MGAVVSNNYTVGAALPKLEDADGNRVLNISAQYLLSLDAETNTATYAIRVVDIPDEHKDTQLMYVPYLVLEDAEGTQTVVYVIESAITVSYNQAATPAE